jgi:hypothetical protein
VELTHTIKCIKPSALRVGIFLKLRKPSIKLVGIKFVAADGRHVINDARAIADRSTRETRDSSSYWFPRTVSCGNAKPSCWRSTKNAISVDAPEQPYSHFSLQKYWGSKTTPN